MLFYFTPSGQMKGRYEQIGKEAVKRKCLFDPPHGSIGSRFEIMGIGH